MLGPVLLSYGNEEQCREHLPKIVRGEIRWCQGYSEPNAGSDLASLQCRAVLDGDAYVVDGQKVWTSHADQSDWIFCLVRTGTDMAVPKHEGIGFLLIDMQTPGIRVRPIRLLSGASPFCETFFENVRVPARNLVGAPGQGWTIAKSLLKHERAALAKLRDAATDDEEPLEAVARRYRTLDPILRDRITQANMDFLCNRYLIRRAKGAAASLLKLYASELNKRRRELRVVAMGWRAIGAGDAADEKQAMHDWLRSRANSIEGGTSEIQLNIIAKQVLGLPE
jgi:alkylation response protein AidB-like acyl-CoA dehydrogenase